MGKYTTAYEPISRKTYRFLLSILTAIFFIHVIILIRDGKWSWGDGAWQIKFITVFFILWMLSYAGLFVIQRVFLSRIYNYAPRFETASKSNLAHEAILSFKRRARGLQLLATLALILVGVCCFWGIRFYANAELNAVTSAGNLEYQLAKEVQGKAISEVTIATARLAEQQDPKGIAYAKAKAVLEAALKLQQAADKNLFEALKTSAIDLSIRRSGVGSKASPAESDSTTIYLVSVLSTKIGAILMLLFLVTILVTLHRYLLRMAAFYDSRADIIQFMARVDILKIDEIKNLFFSESIGFEKQAKSITESYADVLRGMLGEKTSVSELKSKT
jgi:hypothetical protein